MSRQEYQAKIANDGHLTVKDLVGRGGELLGSIVQEDIYIRETGEGNYRLRRENGLLTISYELQKDKRLLENDDKSEAQQFFFKRELLESIIEPEEFKARQESAQTARVVEVYKNRTTVSYCDATVIFDKVECLGSFIKVRCASKDRFQRIIKDLGVDKHEFLKDSYRKMMDELEIPGWMKKLRSFHRKAGELTFGIASGILTAIGLMVGMNSSTSSKIAVMASIAVISCADSLSDSFGIFLSKIAERGTSKMEALRYAGGTFVGKFLFPLTFLIPLAVFDSLTTGVIVNIIWGYLSLTLLTIEQQLVAEDPIWKGLVQNLGLATLIIVLSSLIGMGIQTLAS